MRDTILIVVCIISWVVTIWRLRAILVSKHWKGSQQNILLYWFGMLVCFSTTLTFMITPIASFFDKYTLPNVSILITHCLFLACQYFGMVTLFATLGILTKRSTIHWLQPALVIEYIILLVVYSTLLVKAPDNLTEVPQSISIVIFKLLTYPFGFVLCVVVMQTILTHLPSKISVVLRLRALLIFFSMGAVGLYIFTRLLIYLSYLFPIINTSMLLTSSDILLLCATVLFLAALLSNRMYARFLIFSKIIDAWHTFQDLYYLAQTLLTYCPVVGGLPLAYPQFWLFVFNPDYYIYRAIIAIMDSKITMMGLLQTETSTIPESQLPKALFLHKALQATNPSNDFADIVEAYRRVSKELLANRA